MKSKSLESALPSDARGGAVDAFGPLSVSDSVFYYDIAIAGLGGTGATPGADGTGIGGAIADSYGPITLTRNKFRANGATTAGDDVYGPYTP